MGVKETKKDINYYMQLPYTVQLEKWDDGRGPYFVARIPELPGLLMDGQTPEEALKELEDIKGEWFESCLDRGVRIPEPREPGTQDYSGELRLRMPTSLHRSLAQTAKKEGVSLNSFITNVLSGSVRFGVVAESEVDYVAKPGAVKQTRRKTAAAPRPAKKIGVMSDVRQVAGGAR